MRRLSDEDEAALAAAYSSYTEEDRHFAAARWRDIAGRLEDTAKEMRALATSLDRIGGQS